MPNESINPTTGEVIKQYQEMAPDTVQSNIGRIMERAFQSWRKTSFTETRRPLRKAAKILRKNADEYARLTGSWRWANRLPTSTGGSEQMCVGV